MKNLILLGLIVISNFIYSQASEDFVLVSTDYAKDRIFSKKRPQEKARYKREVFEKAEVRKIEVHDLKRQRLISREFYNGKKVPIGKWIVTNYDGSVDTLDYDFDLQAHYDQGKLCDSSDVSLDSLEKINGYEHAVLSGSDGEDPIMSIYHRIAKTTKYPDAAKDAGISGTVYLEFIIESNANVELYSIVKGAHPFLDVEAVRVMRSLEFSKPAFQDEEAVRTCYTLPIRFSLR